MQSCITLALKGFDRLFLYLLTAFASTRKLYTTFGYSCRITDFAAHGNHQREMCVPNVSVGPVPVQPPEKGSNSPSRLWKLSSDHQNLKTDFVV